MNKLLKILVLLFSLGGITSCEKEGESLTLNQLYEIEGLPTKPFSLRLNGSDYETTIADGLKTNSRFSIEARGSSVSYLLVMDDIEESIYLGAENKSKNFLNYTNPNGLQFSSNKNGMPSDFRIQVTKYDREKKLVSGTFEGTLFASLSDARLTVTDGSFLEVQIVQPEFGQMEATIESKYFIADSSSLTSTNSGGFIFETIEGIGNKDSTTIRITVEEKIRVKEYPFALGAINAEFNANTFSSNVFQNTYNADAGKLTVQSIDTINNTVSGSFNFTFRNAFGEAVEISGGTFNALIR
jgi:hypothetical protein